MPDHRQFTVRQRANRRKSLTGTTTHATGFTLVEMLVAVALVLLIMTLFAQVFQVAGGTVAKQRGMMENDQRARSIQTILKADLDKRTFRWVYPFVPNEDLSAAATEARIAQRQGYWYYSENDPYNDSDDVLQFTTRSDIVTYNRDETPYTGKARRLAVSGGGSLAIHPNQPDADDGWIRPNDTGESPAAEVSYFLRNGNLYRRVLLLRKPLSVNDPSVQPKDIDGDNFFTTDTTVTPFRRYPDDFSSPAPVFWRDFDYAAHFSQRANTSPPPNYVGDGARFVGESDLIMKTPLAGIENYPTQIAYPPNRFGFNFADRNSTIPTGGQPKEYTRLDNDAQFFGRYTLQECSHDGFGYPQAAMSNGENPMAPGTLLTLVNGGIVANTGSLDLTAQTHRRGEDLLLSNVHAFDVKIWDDATNNGLGAFVDIGGSGAVDYAMGNRLNSVYGPHPSSKRIYDTWFPFDTIAPDFQQLDFNGDGSISGANGEQNPPFHPVTYIPSNSPSLPTERGKWVPYSGMGNSIYGVGSLIFPPDNDGTYPPAQSRPAGDPFFYVCVGTNDKNGNGTIEHSSTTDPAFAWPRVAGLRVEDMDLIWQAFDNRKPLRAVQITLRFIDPTTLQIRTLTIVHSLID